MDACRVFVVWRGVVGDAGRRNADAQAGSMNGHRKSIETATRRKQERWRAQYRRFSHQRKTNAGVWRVSLAGGAASSNGRRLSRRRLRAASPHLFTALRRHHCTFAHCARITRTLIAHARCACSARVARGTHRTYHKERSTHDGGRWRMSDVVAWDGKSGQKTAGVAAKRNIMKGEKLNAI